jgi:ribosomal protein S18 acetylase RimI-like enzyme
MGPARDGLTGCNFVAVRWREANLTGAPMAPPDFHIRPCRPGDEAAAYEVCLKTGDSGRDGTHLYPDDPHALGRVFVGPYLSLEPELAFVLTDAAGVCGYVLAALDSERFYRRFCEEWLPPIRAQFPEPSGDPATWSPAQKVYYEYHHPDIHYPESFRVYPAHLHIDLLPRAQGCGQGKRMMEWMLEALVAKGSPGVHLGLSAANQRAYRFYLKLGFAELARVGATTPQVIYMGRKLAVR